MTSYLQVSGAPRVAGKGKEGSSVGTRGPVPKRSNERIRRNKSGRTDKVIASGTVAFPPPDEGLHPQAAAWYRSLAESGQSQYYEPSDWEQARFLAELMSKQLSASRPSSEMVKAILAGMQDLGTTEASRRRMRIEVERDTASAAQDDPRKLSVMERYRRVAGDH